MQAILNIGLNTASGDALDARLVETVLRSVLGAEPFDARVLPSDTEPTVVVSLKQPLERSVLYDLSGALCQDCIAQWRIGGEGELVGPGAPKWGGFSPAFFVMPDGSRLSDSII